MMAPSFKLLRFYLGRLGRVGVAGVVLIVGSLVYDAAVVRPREAALEAQLIRNAAARRAAALRARAATEADASVARQPTLAPAAAAALRRLFSAADKAGLELAQGEYRLTEILSPRMSLQMYLQPLLSAGSYTGFKEAARPRTYDFLRYGQDTGAISYDVEEGAYLVYPGPGGTGNPFLIPNPDFNFTSLRANTVFRWEFKPGSTLYVVWTQQREDETSDGRFAFNQDISRMVRAPGEATSDAWQVIEVARRMGIPQPAIVRLEAGTHSPTLATLARYAGAIGVDLDVRQPA